MRAWRGDVDSSIPMEARDYANLGYTCKAKPFNNAAELLLVKDITPTDYDKLKGLITIYGNDSKIDINTVSSQVLNIVACAVAKNLSVIEGVATDLASRIIELRNTKVYFTSIGDIQDSLTLNADEQSIFDALMPLVKFQSDNFFIEVCGNINKIKSRVQAVYNRTNKNILYWHES
jgi:type II secretory pathway component PulK